ncbi:MAG: ABC transporter substrate-binding protein [Candidatus Bipolaricaulia bacterium]
MKKGWTIFLGLLVLVFALSIAGDAAEQRIELVFWTHEDPNRTELEELYIKWFESLHPNVTIKRVTYPSRNMEEVVLTAFAARKGPDIFNLEIEDAYPYIVNNRVASIDPQAAGYGNLQSIYDDYLAGTLDAVTQRGKLYGLPMELTNWAIFINKKYFREVGLDPETDYPKTWEEMMEISDKLAIRQGDILVRRGFDFRYPYHLTGLLPMVEQLGGTLLSEDGETAIINDAAWLQVLSYLKQWGPNGRNLGSPTYQNARKLFNHDNNDVAMALSGLYQIGRIRNDNLEFFESGEWMVVPFPTWENAVSDYGANYYGHYYMVNAESPSEKQEWAWRFIAFMLDHPDEYLLNAGLVQPKKSLFESEAYASFPYVDVFSADLGRSKMVPLHVANPRFDELLKEAVESVMLTNATPEQALATLKRKANQILKEL